MLVLLVDLAFLLHDLRPRNLRIVDYDGMDDPEGYRAQTH